MKKTEENDSRFNLDTELEAIAMQARGLDSRAIAYCMAYIICMASGKKFQNGAYSPDPSDKYCWYYDRIHEAMAMIWDRFVEIGRDEHLAEALDRIQSSNTTIAEYRRAFKKWASRLSGRTVVGITNEPKEIRKVALSLLGYSGGTPIYNPFAADAAYGQDLQVGNDYYAEEINRETWGMGMMQLLLKGTPSENYRLDAFWWRMDKKDRLVNMKFEYAVCTTPFGFRVPHKDGSKMLAEEALLSSLKDILTESGRMVMAVPSSFLGRMGKAENIRKDITENRWLESVIVLPRGAFAPYSGIQTAVLVIDRGNTSESISLVDATSCMSNKSLDPEAVLSIIGNANYTTIVPVDELRENNYSWDLGKYEHINMKPEDDGAISMELGKFLCTTGTRDFPSRGGRQIMSSDLSSDPFNFVITRDTLKVLDIPEHRSVDDIEAEIAQISHEITRTTSEIEEVTREKNKLSRELKDARVQLDKITFSEKELKDAESKFMSYHTSYDSLMKLRDTAEESYNKQMRSLEAEPDLNLREHMARELMSTHNDEVEPLDQSLQSLARTMSNVMTRIEHLKNEAMRFESLSAEISDMTERRSKCVNLENELETKEEELHQKLTELRKYKPEAEGRKVIKLSRPSLIIGGSSPKAKFAFVDASLEEPVFMMSSNCLAFTVDEKSINLAYLVYQISITEFSTYGAVIPRLRADDILAKRIPVPSMEAQAEFLRLKEYEIFPYKKEIEDLKQAGIRNEEAIMTALGSKQHDMGNLCPKITLRFADLNEMVEGLSDETGEKADMLRLIRIISEDIKDMNRMISILSERSDFPAPVPVNLVEFFQNYVGSHPSTDYNLTFTPDATIDEAGGVVMVDSTEIALTRVLMNIRENAEMHAFEPDTSGTEHFLDIRLHIKGTDVCIDFVNNGKPMPDGMTDTIFATRGEYAGETGHTGNGGWYIASMAKFYGGECHINPEGTEATTIRITLPWSNE